MFRSSLNQYHDTEDENMAVHIFVVDDDAVNLRIADRILSSSGIQVTALRSGAELLAALSAGTLPDLILLDIKMPGMDGFESLSQLRTLEKQRGIGEIPVIFLTADDTADTERHGFEAGVSDYIRKPFDPDILLRRVQNVVSKEKRLHSLREEADTDRLTGFLNKAASERAMTELCSSDFGCLLMIDLDSFKLVNDLYGHKKGDDVLISFAAVLRGALPEGTKIGRIGGDEFVAFAAGMQTADAVAAFTADINAGLVAKAKELMGEEMGIPLGASVGAVFVPQHGADYGALFRLADQSLYTVKKNGKHGFSLYQSDAAQQNSTESSAEDISRLSEILSERAVPDEAFQLDKDAFTPVYRYFMRYIIRNHLSFWQVMFTLHAADGAGDAAFKAQCDAFGAHIRASLRKSDILMRSRVNQYFAVLTNICRDKLDTVTGKLLRSWESVGESGITVSVESKYVSYEEQPAPQSSEYHIVVVDDDESNLRLAGTVLSKAGFRVSAMKSGRALLKYLTEHRPDVLLIDVQMPEMDGFETVRQLRTLPGTAEIPVVFLTASEDSETARTGMQLGAEDFIRKPFLPELLVRRVRRIAELSAGNRLPRFGTEQ